MGMNVMGSSCAKDTPNTVTTPNPNKHNFRVKGYIYGDVYDLLIVNYPDCTTFDGVKLLLVNAGSVDKDTKELDPHFLEDGDVKARFEPTDEGMALANLLRDATNEPSLIVFEGNQQ